jgi:hypothetical protein
MGKTNAELLRSGRFSEIDLEHVAEEIEDLAKRERRSLYNRFVRLLEYLLNWQFQPERRGSSWARTIAEQRQRIQRLLDQNPSFRLALPDLTEKTYQDAAKLVSILTGRQNRISPELPVFNRPASRRRVVSVVERKPNL